MAAASIPAVVVLPFVALITVEPAVRRRPRRPIASGWRRSSRRPGRVVPPPRPLRRLSAPTPRAKATFARRLPPTPWLTEAGASTAARLGFASLRLTRNDHAQRLRQQRHGDREVGEVVAVGVDGERPIGLDTHLRRATDVDLRRC